ncbi:MAG: hypothetical protein ACR2K9_00760 [Solirubrobacteraceae bacterium]
MAEPTRRVLVVAHQTAATQPLLEAVRERAARGGARFHLVVPASAHGLHRVVDPEDNGAGEAEDALRDALPLLTDAAGSEVTGEIGDGQPLSAIADAINRGEFDEIIVSTLPHRVSRWLKLDLVSKARGLGLPVSHVEAPVNTEAVGGAPG